MLIILLSCQDNFGYTKRIWNLERKQFLNIIVIKKLTRYQTNFECWKEKSIFTIFSKHEKCELKPIRKMELLTPTYLDRSVGGSCMLSMTDKRGLYRDPLGFAQANTEVLALREAMIPAFAIETVCCSITCNKSRLRVIYNTSINAELVKARHKKNLHSQEYRKTKCNQPRVTCSWHSQTFCQIHLYSRYLCHLKLEHHSREPEVEHMLGSPIFHKWKII